MSAVKHTPLPYFFIGATVYALDENAQVNRFSTSIQPGWIKQGKSHGTRTTDEECDATARFIGHAANCHYDMLEALKAEEEAESAFDAADEYTHRADAEGWLNDPTGSCHVTEAWDRANKLRATAKELRKAAIARAEGREASE